MDDQLVQYVYVYCILTLPILTLFTLLQLVQQYFKYNYLNSYHSSLFETQHISTALVDLSFN